MNTLRTLLGTTAVVLALAACTPTLGAVPDVSMSSVAGVSTPMSAKDGPRIVRGIEVRGYTNTPRGAAFAAANLLTRSNSALGPQGYRPAILNGFVPGKAQSDLLEKTDQDWTGRSEDGVANAGSSTTSITGYQVMSFRPGRARVAVMFTGVGLAGIMMSYDVVLDLVYSGGTWLAVPPKDGDWATAFHLLGSGASVTKYV